MGNIASTERRSSTSDKGPDASIVGALLATLPPLTNVQRQAFREQFTLAQCDAIGVLAAAPAVSREALAWLRPIDRTLARHSLLVRRYGRARFAWFLECIRDLGEALEIRRGGGAPSSTRHARAERVRRAALRIREELIEAISVLAEGDEGESERLAAAAGAADTPEELSASLHALARLAEDWMDHEGPVTRALVASVDLTVADIEAAHAAAHAVAGGHGDREEDHGDHRAVGRAAGRVLLEMGLAMRIFERARRWDRRVPRLLPGPETRAALAAPVLTRAEGEPPQAPG
jgi:hypothetical protein